MSFLLYLLILVTPVLAASSFCLTAAPEPLKASELMLGSGRDYGVWQLSITQATGAVTRGQISERLPFAALFEWQAVDVLTRRSVGSKRAALAAYFGAIKDLGPAGLAYAGARVSNPYAKVAVLAASGLWALAVGRTMARAPDAATTKVHLLPDAGVPGDWDGVIVTGIVRSAGKIGPLCKSAGGL